jgi:hypothetical protein
MRGLKDKTFLAGGGAHIGAARTYANEPIDP